MCRKLGISRNTFYRWKRRIGEMAPSESKCLKQLEAENRRLKAMGADLALDQRMLQEVLRKRD